MVKGDNIDDTTAQLIEKLVKMQFVRNNIEFGRGTFRVKGDNVDILPTSENKVGIRISFFDDEIERIATFDVVTGKVLKISDIITIFPATHFVLNDEKTEVIIIDSTRSTGKVSQRKVNVAELFANGYKIYRKK